LKYFHERNIEFESKEAYFFFDQGDLNSSLKITDLNSIEKWNVIYGGFMRKSGQLCPVHAKVGVAMFLREELRMEGVLGCNMAEELESPAYHPS